MTDQVPATTDKGSSEESWKDHINPAVVYAYQDKQRRYRKKVEDLPPHFDDPVLLQKKIDSYFDQCDEAGQVYTIPDLSYFLGLTKKKGVRLYIKQRKDDCSKVLEAALTRIEGQRNRQLVSGQGQMAGRIFDLKCNFGYKEDGPEAEDNQEKKKGDQYQFNIYAGMPPAPRDMEEWTRWYQQYYQKKRELEASQDDKGKTINVKSSKSKPQKASLPGHSSSDHSGQAE